MTTRHRLVLLAAILGSSIVFLDATVVNVALPAISDDLGAGLAGQQWVVEAYLLATVSLILVGGSFGDRFGRRRMFLTGLVGFGISSILCAEAPSQEALIGFRALQGVSGALLVPGSLAILAATFDGADRGRAIGFWTAWIGISTILGPAGGGAIVDSLSWRWIFWVNVPLVVITILLTVRVVDESRDPGATGDIDYLAILLSVIGLGGPVLALIEQPAHGWSATVVWLPMIAGLASMAAFLIHESRTSDPMLDLDLFRIRNFWVVNATTLAVYGGLMGGILFIGLYMQQTLGYPALDAGLATTPISVMVFLLSPRMGRYASAHGPRLPIAVGPIVAGAGMLLMLRIDADADYVTGILPAILVFGLGLSVTVAPLTATALDSVGPNRAGIASGVNNGISRVAGLLAIAVLGAAISSAFVTRLNEEIDASPLSPSANAVVAGAELKPLAVPEAGSLQPAERDLVVSASRRASTEAFHLGAVLAALLMIAGGTLAGAAIRNPAPTDPAGRNPAPTDRAGGAAPGTPAA